MKKPLLKVTKMQILPWVKGKGPIVQCHSDHVGQFCHESIETSVLNRPHMLDGVSTFHTC